MSEQQPAESKKQALAERVDRTVRRLLQNEYLLEELGKWDPWIRQPEVAKRIGEQNETEVIGAARDRSR